jgi:hypothetical protein
MWDTIVPDEEDNIANDIGCSDAVAREAAPSSATDDSIDIAQRMAHGPVNLVQATSVMGRGPIRQNGFGVSAHRLENDAQEAHRGNIIDDALAIRDDGVKTSDAQRFTEHRGNRYPDDAQGTQQQRRCAEVRETVVYRRIADNRVANQTPNRGDRRGIRNIADDGGRRGLNSNTDAQQVSRGTSFSNFRQSNHPLGHRS